MSPRAAKAPATIGACGAGCRSVETLEAFMKRKHAERVAIARAEREAKRPKP